MASTPSLSIRAVAGTFWSSGREPKSKKHSFSITSSSFRASKLLWRHLRRSASESTTD
ncbi:unnamed protein product, partial [Vitis vinifera]|uniref:Uncharacterized protein n=1 Tax=Vitis vinifera TaxID=29760 RepID=E0CVV6_VITVI